MFEKVNPGHPDKMADRLAGAIVDLCYQRAGGLTSANPRVAVEVLAGHGRVDVIVETSLGRMDLRAEDIDPLIHRIFGERVDGHVLIAAQDEHLAANQQNALRCGDNGIFKGCRPTYEQEDLTKLMYELYKHFPTDGKAIIDTVSLRWPNAKEQITICQSCASKADIWNRMWKYAAIAKPIWNTQYIYEEGVTINPLGEWTGGPDVDCGATNRKLGSDMGDGVTGGGLHGKDLSKADVSVNIVCFLKAVASGMPVTAICSIGDEEVTFTYDDGKQETETFADIVEMARLYILTDCDGSFERFAEWGLIRPQ